MKFLRLWRILTLLNLLGLMKFFLYSWNLAVMSLPLYNVISLISLSRKVKFQRLGNKLMWFLFTKVVSSLRMMLVVTALSHWQVFCARLLRSWFLFVSWSMWMSKVFCLIISLVFAVVEIVSKCWSNSFIYFAKPLMIVNVILWMVFS